MKEKIKTIILAIALILISIGIGVGVFWYFPHQKAVKECKIQCRYDEYTKVWEYGLEGRLIKASRFPTYEQCIDYCLTVK